MSTTRDTAARATQTENDPRWAAIVARDPAADGMFYYSVATTGVYCRPSCGARQARRENVCFHATREAAEQAGFRPCKRCKPDQPTLAQRHSEQVTKACRIIESSQATPSLQTLARSVGTSPSHFHRIFRQVTGLTPRQYAIAQREQRMRDGLGRTCTVTDALFEAGYNSTSRFYEHSDAALGMTPTHYRGGGPGETIRFAVGECSLGSILVASSGRGICAILLGHDPDALACNLQDQFPHADLVGGDHGFEQLVARVVGCVETPNIGLDLPLDIRGTAFQKRVWQAMRTIPVGETISYSALANRIGVPTSARAVARACAANPLAVAIPCHRVVRKNGAPSGYRWGVERKCTLLDREARPAAASPN